MKSRKVIMPEDNSSTIPTDNTTGFSNPFSSSTPAPSSDPTIDTNSTHAYMNASELPPVADAMLPADNAIDPTMATSPTDAAVPTPTPPPVDPATTAVDPAVPPAEPTAPSDQTPVNDVPAMPAAANTLDPVPSIYIEVAKRISDSQNVLVALSSDPSVDEMAAAIGLSLYLDKLGKRATAIYSGSTPNALEFLKPEETFESTADTLQDFVIALNKDKADHLRYKLDGDYVKIYITPYHSRINEEDLEFSYGDFNVDLVLALDVANGIDLDSALREHGRIMHDAVIINITTGKPGKFGEIEWNDKTASSVSEMIARLLYSANSEVKVEKDEATAFLTGIVAATDRFSNAKTTPETMKVASLLMESGANQQLVSKNITSDIDNEMFSLSEKKKVDSKNDPTKLDIEHEGIPSEQPETPASEQEVSTSVTKKEHTLLDDLKAAEESLAQAGAETTPENLEEPLKIDSETAETPSEAEEDVLNSSKDGSLDALEEPQTNSPSEPTPIINTPDNTLEPSPELKSEFGAPEDNEKYGQMLENALESSSEQAPTNTSVMSGSPINPATSNTPEVSTQPEINGVPEINYMPMPDEEILPPPPAPPIDPVELATPVEEPTPEPLGSQPSMQDQVYVPQASDPGAFKIPGM